MPLFILGGAGGGGSVANQFRILTFTNDEQCNEIGTVVTSVTFNWQFANGVPVEQSIQPSVGSIPPGDRTVALPEQLITTDTTFTLTAKNEETTRTATSSVGFYYPTFFGSVPNINPTEADILNMARYVNGFKPFTATVNISNAHSCFVSPMTNPIIDIRERIFGLSFWDTFIIINNVPIHMLDGLPVLCRVAVRSIPEDTMGLDIQLDVIF